MANREVGGFLVGLLVRGAGRNEVTRSVPHIVTRAALDWDLDDGDPADARELEATDQAPARSKAIGASNDSSRSSEPSVSSGTQPSDVGDVAHRAPHSDVETRRDDGQATAPQSVFAVESAPRAGTPVTVRGRDDAKAKPSEGISELSAPASQQHVVAVPRGSDWAALQVHEIALRIDRGSSEDRNDERPLPRSIPRISGREPSYGNDTWTDVGSVDAPPKRVAAEPVGSRHGSPPNDGRQQLPEALDRTHEDLIALLGRIETLVEQLENHQRTIFPSTMDLDSTIAARPAPRGFGDVAAERRHAGRKWY